MDLDRYESTVGARRILCDVSGYLDSMVEKSVLHIVYRRALERLRTTLPRLAVCSVMALTALAFASCGGDSAGPGPTASVSYRASFDATLGCLQVATVSLLLDGTVLAEQSQSLARPFQFHLEDRAIARGAHALEVRFDNTFLGLPAPECYLMVVRIRVWTTEGVVVRDQQEATTEPFAVRAGDRASFPFTVP
jgi:hypothetical protein